MERSRLARALALIVAGISFGSPVTAQIMQPNGAQVPSDPGCTGGEATGLLATFACICAEAGVCNIGAPCSAVDSCPTGMNGTCESRMYHVFNDNTCIPSLHDGLNPRVDAALVPETFTPTCALTFTVESRGTAIFENAFGWYNVTSSGDPPSTDDLHVMLDCDDPPGTTVVLDVRSEPAYEGGEIGFFLLTPEDHTTGGTCAAGNCCSSVARYRGGAGFVYYSERALNPDHRGVDSFIHLLTYDSVLSERKFFFAWEDTYDTANNDFTDLVTSVTGVECGGAGAECDTGGVGACQAGITRCTDDEIECVPRYVADDERCDGNDNDCDSMVDEDVACPAEEVCEHGECVTRCDVAVEFPCAGFHTDCDLATGLCVDPACVGVTCGADQVCQDGICRSECEGVVCPSGLVCILDRCVDVCAAVTCAAGTVCRGGFCVPGCNACDGVVCGEDEVCDEASADCRDATCPASCPEGQVCDGPGGCHDPCDDAVCPPGQSCEDGRCENDDAVVMRRDAGVPRDAARPMTTADGSLADAGTGPRTSNPGCACRAGSRREARSEWAFGALVLLALFVRRRRGG